MTRGRLPVSPIPRIPSTGAGGGLQQREVGRDGREAGAAPSAMDQGDPGAGMPPWAPAGIGRPDGQGMDDMGNLRPRVGGQELNLAAQRSLPDHQQQQQAMLQALLLAGNRFKPAYAESGTPDLGMTQQQYMPPAFGQYGGISGVPMPWSWPSQDAGGAQFGGE